MDTNGDANDTPNTEPLPPDEVERRRAEVKRKIEEAMAMVARDYSPMQSQRAAGFDRLSTPVPAEQGGSMPCRACTKPIDRHLHGVCRECFVLGVDPRVAAASAQPGGPEAPRAADPSAPRCNFCGRQAGTDQMQPGETMMRGQGAHICSACSVTVAGCIGARDANEARRMMAQAALQAEAVVQCTGVMKLAGQVRAELAKALDANTAKTDGMPNLDGAQGAFGALMTLTEAAETFARIARGDR